MIVGRFGGFTMKLVAKYNDKPLKKYIVSGLNSLISYQSTYMLTISLVRHGQASFGAANYDQLSELGGQQSVMLGQYFAERENKFDRIIMGNMLRHRQTAEGIAKHNKGLPEFEYHEGFNEYDFSSLQACFSRQYPDQLETIYEDRRHFYAILKRALKAWSQDRLEQPQESWGEFHQRLQDGLNFARNQKADNVLVVSSAGAISGLVSQALGLDADGMIQLNLQIRNSAITELIGNQQRSQLSAFNQVPHLQLPGHQEQYITYS